MCVCFRSKKDKGKGVVKTDTSDPEPEGLTLLVPDIQRTAEIVYTATTSLRQANQGTQKTHSWGFIAKLDLNDSLQTLQ